MKNIEFTPQSRKIFVLNLVLLTVTFFLMFLPLSSFSYALLFILVSCIFLSGIFNLFIILDELFLWKKEKSNRTIHLNSVLLLLSNFLIAVIIFY